MSTEQTREAVIQAALSYQHTVASEYRLKDAMAAHDLETARKAWAEGFDAGERDAMDPRIDTHTCTPNPYKEAAS